jgi:hypothetical protein
MRLDSQKLRSVLAALFAAMSLIVLAVPAAAEHLATLGRYSVSVTPVICETTSPCGLSFTLTNQSPASAYFMDEATIKAPAGFTITSVGEPTTSPIPRNWDAEWNGGDTVRIFAVVPPDLPLSGDALLPSESVSVTVTLVAASLAVGPTNTFETHAFGTDPLEEDDGKSEFGRIGDDPNVMVVGDQQICEETQPCSTQEVSLAGNDGLGISKTSAKAFSPGGAVAGGTLEVSVGGRFAQQIQGGFCQNNFDDRGWAVTTDVTGDEDTRSHEVTVRLAKVINNAPGAPGAANFEICMAADEPFPTKPGTPAAQQNPNTLMWEGVLPNCPAVRTKKCMISRTRNSGDAILKYFVDPGDPTGLPGLGPFGGI